VVSHFPGWLQSFAANQLVTITINALRALLEGGVVYVNWGRSVVWGLGIVVVFLVLFLTLYLKATAWCIDARRIASRPNRNQDRPCCLGDNDPPGP
jgi:ABC-type transport system involved in Fe-S cluster assembly fused permease/ATPase subunit